MACNGNLHRVSGMQVMMIALGDGNCKPLPDGRCVSSLRWPGAALLQQASTQRSNACESTPLQEPAQRTAAGTGPGGRRRWAAAPTGLRVREVQLQVSRPTCRLGLYAR